MLPVGAVRLREAAIAPLAPATKIRIGSGHIGPLSRVQAYDPTRRRHVTDGRP
jgi:hypothetical protein